MNELNHINRDIFKESKNFRLFLIFYFILFLFVVGVIFSYTYCFSQMENAINDEYNKIITIRINKNFFDFENFYNTNQEKIEKKFIDVYIQDISLLGERFDLVTSEEDFDLETPSIKISKKYDNKKLLKILDLEDFNIEYTIDEENTIYCNQLFSEEILKIGFPGIISLKIKDYNDLNKLLNQLKDCNLEANLNSDVNGNIIMYKKTQKIIFFIFVGMLLLTLFITIFQLIQFFYEQKKNLLIYNVIGVNLLTIFKMYIQLILFYTCLCYFINLFIYYIIGNLFVYGFNNTMFFEYNALTVIIILTINIVESFIQIVNIRKVV